MLYKTHNNKEKTGPVSYRLIILSVMLIFMAGFAASAMADAPSEFDNLPFAPGEKLNFELKWGIIRAGKATMEVFPLTTINGEKAFHFVLTVKTTRFIDAFYKVRDRIDSYTDIGLTRTLLYKKNQREGSTRRNIVVNFDWKKGEATYTNFNEKRAPIKLLPGSLDPLSAFYFTRKFDFSKTPSMSHAITDGKKSVTGKAKVVNKERIRIKKKKVHAWLIEPDLKHVSGVFKKSKKAKIKIWVSDDHLKIPLRVKSKVSIGSFVGELISSRGLKPKPVIKTDKPQ